MLEKIITLYRKAEMGIINEMSGASENVMDEIAFYDVGYMQSKISKIQTEIQRITKEIEISLEVNESSDYEKERRSRLMEEREHLLFHMIFLASNSFKNIDDCIEMSDGHNFAFRQCIRALKEYQSGKHENAFVLLEEYYRSHGNVEKHFLVNKVFGLLLMEKNLHQKAIAFLTYALQFVPDDVECLTALGTCYKVMDESDKANIVNELLSVLS